MATLDVHVSVVGGKTVSGFVIEDNDHVIFYNDGGAPLKIEFPGGSPLCDKQKVPQTPINVPVGAKSDKLKVCKDTTGKSFKYDATIVGAAAEDPIFIIEKASLFGGGITSSMISLGLGVVGGYIVARMLHPNKVKLQA
jgi:hypothetical protein